MCVAKPSMLCRDSTCAALVSFSTALVSLRASVYRSSRGIGGEKELRTSVRVRNSRFVESASWVSMRSKSSGYSATGEPTISESNAAASPTCAEFSEGGEGFVGVGEKSVQHSSQSNQYWVVRVRIARAYLMSARASDTTASG